MKGRIVNFISTVWENPGEVFPEFVPTETLISMSSVNELLVCQWRENQNINFEYKHKKILMA